MRYLKYQLLGCLLLNFLCLLAQDKPKSPYFSVQNGQHLVEKFPLLSTDVIVNISGVIAEVELTQYYHNTGNQPIEAIYLFPASTQAAVHGMTMLIGQRKIEATIKEKTVAKREYQEAKRTGKSAALLKQQRPNVFRMNVANILPNDTVKVILKYTELLVPEEGIYEFVYPTVVGPRYAGENVDNFTTSLEPQVTAAYLKKNKKVPANFNLDICVNTGLPLQNIHSTSHQIEIDLVAQHEATVHLAAHEKKVNHKDFILQYQLKGSRIESGLMTYEGEEENYFLLMMQPPKSVIPKALPKREYIFLIDVSGSMSGFPLDVSKNLIKDLVNRLQPHDKFNLMFFAGDNYLLSPTSLSATQDNLNLALKTIDNQRGSGRTNMLSAIKKAMGQIPEPRFSRNFVIITDGYISVEPAAFDYIKNHLGTANFFAFGIGSSVNRHLIEGVAHTGQGAAFVVTKKSEAPMMAERFRRYIQSPVLTDIQIAYDGFDVYDLNTTQIPDLLGERPLMIYGKYEGQLKGHIEITGQTGQGNFYKKIKLSEQVNQDNAALRYLWARKKIEQLGDFADLHYQKNKEAIKTQITELGLKYNLLTPYTSFIAVDNQIRNPNGEQRKIKQPLPLSEGMADFDSNIPLPPPPPSPKVEEIFKIVEEMPRFYCEKCEILPTKQERKKCSDAAMLEVIYKNLKYPPELQSTCISGRIIIRFIVKKDGRIAGIKVVRGLHKLFDKEAIRVIKLLEKWIPGTQRGKKVDVVYNIPIRISLE